MCVLKVTQDIATKSPLRDSLVRNIGWLVHAKIIEHKEQCISQLRSLLSYLVDASQQTASCCDDVLQQHQDFIDTPSTLEALSLTHPRHG